MSWLGGRDSNPDTMVQSHVSYRWTTSHQEGKPRLYRPTVKSGKRPPGLFTDSPVNTAASAYHPDSLKISAEFLGSSVCRAGCGLLNRCVPGSHSSQSAPAEFRSDVLEDAFEHVGVVVHAQLVRDREE